MRGAEEEIDCRLMMTMEIAKVRGAGEEKWRWKRYQMMRQCDLRGEG